MKILVIDNYDSFTYNLVQMLAGEGAQVDVVRNDVESVDELLAHGAAGIVLSPGPGRPEDAGVCLDLLDRLRSSDGPPVLGVCLGHQAMGAVYGARIERAPTLMHGKTSPVHHDGTGPFRDLPDPFEATRYHSLVVAPDTLPDDLVPNAWSEEAPSEKGSGDRVLMGVRHRELPWWGVQFHPESILTETGPRMMKNFLAMCAEEETS